MRDRGGDIGGGGGGGGCGGCGGCGGGVGGGGGRWTNGEFFEVSIDDENLGFRFEFRDVEFDECCRFPSLVSEGGGGGAGGGGKLFRQRLLRGPFCLRLGGFGGGSNGFSCCFRRDNLFWFVIVME